VNRTTRALLFLLALGVSSSSCRKKPDPGYLEAERAFDSLYTRKQDDAFLDPELVSIEQKLGAVSPESLNWAQAQQLLARIASGREAAQAAEAARQQMLAEASKPTPYVRSNEPGSAAPGAEAAAPDAGDASTPGVGMTLEELKNRFSQCFEPGVAVDTPDRGRLDSYQLRDLYSCRNEHPSWVNKLALFEGGKILVALDQAKVIRELRFLDGGLVDGGAR
jgi:hypothetical protein